MSRVKVGPVTWRDEGPASPVTTYRVVGYGLAHAIPPPISIPATTPARRAQMAALRERQRAKRLANKVPCGRVFTSSYRGTCARGIGHGGVCRSQESLDHESARRRAA